MISLLFLLGVIDAGWLTFVGCERQTDEDLVRALVALDAPRGVMHPVVVTCLEAKRARISFDETERDVDLQQVSFAMQPQMLTLMIVDTVRTRMAMPIEASASAPVIPTTLEQLNRRRDPRYARLTAGMSIGFVGASLLLMSIGIGVTILGQNANDVGLRTTGIGIAIASPFLFAAGGVTFAFWLHDRLTYAHRDVGGGARLAFAW